MLALSPVDAAGTVSGTSLLLTEDIARDMADVRGREYSVGWKRE